MGACRGPIFRVGEFLVFAAFAFHALNGVRLVLVELGFAIGKPIEPVYPYRTSVDVQRPLAIGVMILAAILVIVGGSILGLRLAVGGATCAINDLWTWHIGAGAVILVLLGLHMTIMHLDGIVRVVQPAAGRTDRLGQRRRAGQERRSSW